MFAGVFQPTNHQNKVTRHLRRVLTPPSSFSSPFFLLLLLTNAVASLSPPPHLKLNPTSHSSPFSKTLLVTLKSPLQVFLSSQLHKSLTSHHTPAIATTDDSFHLSPLFIGWEEDASIAADNFTVIEELGHLLWLAVIRETSHLEGLS